MLDNKIIMGKTIPHPRWQAGMVLHIDQTFLSFLALTALSWLFRKNVGELYRPL